MACDHVLVVELTPDQHKILIQEIERAMRRCDLAMERNRRGSDNYKYAAHRKERLLGILHALAAEAVSLPKGLVKD